MIVIKHTYQIIAFNLSIFLLNSAIVKVRLSQNGFMKWSIFQKINPKNEMKWSGGAIWSLLLPKKVFSTFFHYFSPLSWLQVLRLLWNLCVLTKKFSGLSKFFYIIFHLRHYLNIVLYLIKQLKLYCRKMLEA